MKPFRSSAADSFMAYRIVVYSGVACFLSRSRRSPLRLAHCCKNSPQLSHFVHLLPPIESNAGQGRRVWRVAMSVLLAVIPGPRLP